MSPDSLSRLVQDVSAMYRDADTLHVTLGTARAEGGRQYPRWRRLLDELQEGIQGATVRDFTDLAHNPSFGLQLTLVPPKRFLEDERELLRQVGGRLSIVWGHASLVRPVGYVNAFLMQDTGDGTLRFEDLGLEDPSVREVCQAAMSALERYGWEVLRPGDVRRVVPVATECTEPPNTVLFHCLFSDHLSP